MTSKDIRQIFYSIANGIGNHGKFLRTLAEAVMRSDQDNLDILRPSLEEIIKKYNLNSTTYLNPDWD